MPPVIWIDIEDVMVHLQWWARPSGIQRLSYETARALVEIAGEQRIRFVRHAPDGFVALGFAELRDAYAAAVAGAARADRNQPAASARRAIEEADPAAQVPSGLRQVWRRAKAKLPADVQMALLEVLLPQWAVVRAVPRLLRIMVRGRPTRVTVATGGEVAAMAAGDVLFGLAAPWSSEHMQRATAAVRDRGLRYATLVYDMIPVVRPEFAGVSVARRFSAWAGDMLPLAHLTMAISHATRRDIEGYAARDGFTLRAPVRVVPLGTGFPSVPASAADAAAVPDEPYVLCVSTIEVRKNHLLLFRAWRRLIDTMPHGQVPLLVFAGSMGWLVDDLMQQLRNSAFLDGRVRVVEAPSDGMLEALYRGAMFTVYPSHYEGWGLPVVESLAFGTPCLAADTSSMPEAGGDLARYFCPDDVGDATRQIRTLIDNPHELTAWRDEVRARFCPVPWHRTAEAILAAIDAATAPPSATHPPSATAPMDEATHPV